MGSPSVVNAPRRSRRRRFLWFGAAVLVFLGLTGGYLGVRGFLDDHELREAVREADRLDPGWRFADLESARAPMSDRENAALQVLAARRLFPAAAPPRSSQGTNLVERVNALAPEVPLDDPLKSELRATLAKWAAPIKMARGVAEMPHGRYPVAWSSDLVGTLMPHLQDAREVAGLLCLDATLRIEDGDLKAIVSLQAALNTGRSVGDEPAAISQLVRSACEITTLRSLERTLARGATREQDLAGVQRLLEDEMRQPLQLMAARSERAMMDASLQAFRNCKVNRAAFGLKSSALGDGVDGLMDSAYAGGSEPIYLRYLTAYVEIAKLPPDRQDERLQQLHVPETQLPKLLEALTRGDDHRTFAAAFHRWLALMRCGSTALAAERYRLEHHRWPDSLEALAPRYLAEVPADPFDGRLLRCRRLADGLVIYSVGPDRQDDGGTIDRTGVPGPGARPGTDLGFRLWDVEKRR